MKNENTSIEYGRVSALKIGKFNEDLGKIKYTYMPQIEIVEYRDDNGETVSQKFVCLSCDKETVKFDKEIDALQYAIKTRNEINGGADNE